MPGSSVFLLALPRVSELCPGFSGILFSSLMFDSQNTGSIIAWSYTSGFPEDFVVKELPLLEPESGRALT